MNLSEEYKQRLHKLSGIISEDYDLMAKLHQTHPQLSDNDLAAHLHKSDKILSVIDETVSDIKTAEQLIQIYSEIVYVLNSRIEHFQKELSNKQVQAN